MQFVQGRKLPTLLYIIDAEKAFDWVEWALPKDVLNRMGFGPSFMTWVELIYSVQEPDILMKVFKSSVITLYTVVRQSCPLSLLRFNSDQDFGPGSTGA